MIKVGHDKIWSYMLDHIVSYLVIYKFLLCLMFLCDRSSRTKYQEGFVSLIWCILKQQRVC